MSKFLAGWGGGGCSPHSHIGESPVLITFAPESFWILFYIQGYFKVVSDGKLQVTLAYYLYYKWDFSYCQTLWLLKR